MSGNLIGNESLFTALCIANNERNQATYTIIRDLIDNEYRDRIPATLLPWDDLFPQDFEELSTMVYEKEREFRTDNVRQPIVAMKMMAKNMRTLVTSSKWGARLWPVKKEPSMLTRLGRMLVRILNRILGRTCPK